MTRTLVLACTIALALAGCEREVLVQGETGTMHSPVLPGPAGAAGLGGAGGFGAPPIAGAAGGVPQAGAGSGGLGGSSAQAGGAGGTGQPPAPAPPPSGVLAGIEQAWPGASTLVDRFEVLSDQLRSIERPALGTSGVSLLQFQGSSRALTVRVGWDHTVERWYDRSGAYRAYNAAYGERHLSLLHAESYGIFANGSDAELSGTPQTYKESLAASGAGIAWVDYPAPVGDTFGEIVLQHEDGSRAVLSDRARYRASLALSESHLAYVEYASTDPGAAGQVVVQPLAGGPSFAVAPSAHHQDRPAIDGDWLVFEEYVSDSDAVIRAFNLASGELRDLSAAPGFRSNADVYAGRVVWEDYRNGSSDIFGLQLDVTTEQPIVTGAGHSAVPRVSADGLVWIETSGATVALVRAFFRHEP